MRGLALLAHRRLELMSRPAEGGLDPSPRGVPGLRVEILRDPHELCAARPQRHARDVSRHAAAGARVIAARHSGRVVSARWIATGRVPIDYLGRELLLPDRHAYVYDSWTAPEWRGRGAGATLAAASLDEALAMGAATCVAAVLRENEVGMRAARRAGYRTRGRIGWTGVPPLRRWFIHASLPGLSWAPR